ncbi:MAG TPA: class I SAM-dependent methyltransferase [Ignavibacteria bacterium]|nr:class I SAM-dependent methyltransferase [Ignavibacteria bacterium]
MDLKYLKHLARIGSTFIHPKGFEATELLISKLNIQPSDNILEIGCGTGGTLIEIINRFGIKVTAVEILDEMIIAAEKKLKSLKLTDRAEIISIKPGEKYPFENNSFNKIYAESVLGFQDKAGMEFIFSEVKRLLKPNGLLIINDALWKQGVPDNTVNKIVAQAYKDFGLAHASPSNIDLEKLIKIAESEGLELMNQINLTKDFIITHNSTNMKTASPFKNILTLIVEIKYKIKFKKHQKYTDLVSSYLILFGKSSQRP